MLSGLQQLFSAGIRQRAKTYLFSVGAVTACLTIARFDPATRSADSGWWILFAIGALAVISKAVRPAASIEIEPVTEVKIADHHEHDLATRSLIRN